MKANQAFRNEEEAVSPVIGVILMVAITVVLAAVVFVLVQNLSKGAEKAPDMSFTKDNSAGTVAVVKAPPTTAADALNWFEDITVGGDCAAAKTLNGGAWPTDNTVPVSAGDIIGGCVAGDTLTITHNGSGTLVYQTSFT